MQIEITIDETCMEPKVTVRTNKMTDEINEMLKVLSDRQPKTILGYKENCLEILSCGDVVNIFSENHKVYARTVQNQYLLHARLYELEEKLDPRTFVRISNSEIINLRKVKSMDLSFAGSICMNLQGNIKTFVSRRYVAKIKEVLGI